MHGLAPVQKKDPRLVRSCLGPAWSRTGHWTNSNFTCYLLRCSDYQFFPVQPFLLYVKSWQLKMCCTVLKLEVHRSSVEAEYSAEGFGSVRLGHASTFGRTSVIIRLRFCTQVCSVTHRVRSVALSALCCSHQSTRVLV